MSERSRAVVASMAASVASITSAADAAEELLNRTSNHISDVIENVDASNQDEVEECFNQLQAFADQLSDEAGQLSAAVVAGTPADPAANNGGGASAGSSAGGSGTFDPHSREGAAAAGGYDAPLGQQSGTLSDASAQAGAPAGSVVADTDAAAAAEGDTVDASDGDRITSQEGREEAGPFTGTGAQDALRTSGRLGDTDAHVADTRTVEEGADERTQNPEQGGDAGAGEADAQAEGGEAVGDGGSTNDSGDTTDGDDAA